MNDFANRVFVQLRNVTHRAPICHRKYTITHSDDTGDLFVVIGLCYAEDRIMELRDEVRLEWRMHYKKPVLIGRVLIDGEGIRGNSKQRNEIFKREMDTALKAINYADRAFFQVYPELCSTPVYIHFQSEHGIYNKWYDFGTIGQYQLKEKKQCSDGSLE